MASGRDFYEVLGVPRDATPEQVQRAYREMARANHPDVNKDPAAEERFKDASEAYDVLSDPDSRRRYDAFGPQFRQVPDDVSPEDFARARARGSSRAGAGGGGRWAGTGAGASDGVWFGSGTGEGFGAEGIDFDDLFGDLFGNARGARGTRSRSRAWGPVAGADQEAELVLSVEEAYRGGRRTITVSGPDGPRTLEVTIPAGVTDGQRIRLAGQGAGGTGGAAPGDLYLVVRIAPHPIYRLDGRDIHVDLPLTPWEAALGASVAVETPGGEAKLRVPPGTSSGRKLRLRGRGLPNPRGRPGDLFADVRIMVPPSLTNEERRLFEELATISTFDPRRQR